MNIGLSEAGPARAAWRCPSCGESAAYGLNDGRRQCKHCRTKYTPGPRQGRLDDQTLRRIAALFWDLCAQETAAREAGLNRKTLQRYFTLLRGAIAREGHKRMERNLHRTRLASFFVGSCLNSESEKERDKPLPVFSLGLVREEAVLFLPDGLRDWSGLDLDGVISQQELEAASAFGGQKDEASSEKEGALAGLAMSAYLSMTSTYLANQGYQGVSFTA